MIGSEAASGDTVVDVVVIGAGAAGLMAAIRAAERGVGVLLLEKNRRAGVKILMSGGTRCNITNARGLRNRSVVTGPIDERFDWREARGGASIIAAFGEGGAFLRPALKAFSVERSVELFEGEGVATKVEANGKIFPVSDRAVDVLEALLRRLDRVGGRMLNHAAVSSIEGDGEGAGGLFRLKTPDRLIEARRVVLATGGQSFPGSGTTGDGFRMACELGHTLVEPRPSLVPLAIGLDWLRALSGITVVDTNVAVVNAQGQVIDARREAVLFTHWGLSGPAILDISREIARRAPEALGLRIDFAPALTEERLNEEIAGSARVGRRHVWQLLPEFLPRRLADALVAQAGVSADRLGPDLTRAERARLVGALKRLIVPVSGTLGFAKAEVTSGGVALGEVSPETLESRIQPGLFLCGEVLDLDGRIGGYNFQAAWSTGWLAGDSAARSILPSA